MPEVKTTLNVRLTATQSRIRNQLIDEYCKVNGDLKRLQTYRNKLRDQTVAFLLKVFNPTLQEAVQCCSKMGNCLRLTAPGESSYISASNEEMKKILGQKQYKELMSIHIADLERAVVLGKITQEQFDKIVSKRRTGPRKLHQE